MSRVCNERKDRPSDLDEPQPKRWGLVVLVGKSTELDNSYNRRLTAAHWSIATDRLSLMIGVLSKSIN